MYKLKVWGKEFLFPLSLFAFLSLILQYSSPWLVGYDGYFHVKFSYLLREYLYIDELPWLQFTIYKEHFRNHHLLFHYLIVPFTYIDLMTAGKLAASFFMALAWFGLYMVLRVSGIPYPMLWALIGFVSSNAFLYRLSMVRVQSTALFFLLIIFLFHMQKRYKLIFTFSLLFVYLYDAFPLILFISFAFTVSELLIDKQLNYRYLVSSGSGILTGLVINPYFPENIESFFFNIYRTIFLKEKFIRLGSEWYPYSTWGLLENMLPAAVGMGILILFLPFVKNVKREEYAALILCLGFLFLTFKSRRFIEYSPVFVMLTFALVFLRRVDVKHSLLVAILFIPLSVMTFQKAKEDVKGTKNPIQYEGASLWLKENSNPGDIVFNSDWDDFPFLFFYNHKNYYILGLDPMYMYKYDPKLYRRYQRITKGRVNNPGREIAESFKAKFIFTDKKHRAFIKALKGDKYAEKVYEDKWSVVYKLKGEKLPRED